MKHIKRLIKSVIGKDNAELLYRYYKYVKFYNYQRVKLLNSNCKRISQFQNPKINIFCGYFDIIPNSPLNKNEILLHVLEGNAKHGKDKIGLAVGNIENGTYNIFAYSRAWSWQMGARLRWSRTEPNTVFYNDYIDNEYCCIKYNIEKKCIILKYDMPLYDISRDETFGVGINFERLQRLRPGYGYSCSEDKTRDDIAPKDDGLYYVDLKTGEKKLFIRFFDLKNLHNSKDAKEHYVNHISISPDGKNIMFFHLWTKDGVDPWMANLCVYNLENSKVTYLEKSDVVSHYTWKNNDVLLITALNPDSHKCVYREYHIKSGIRKDLEDTHLMRDGHPTYLTGEHIFCSDTYPDEKSMQTLFLYGESYIPLAQFFHDPRMVGEKRCDLHPHLFLNKSVIAVDSICYGKRRCVIILKC